jgi:hypothetical protein
MVSGRAVTPEKLAQNSELWDGLVAAKTMGLTRAIGVSSYNATHLAALKGPEASVPSLLAGPDSTFSCELRIRCIRSVNSSVRCSVLA